MASAKPSMPRDGTMQVTAKEGINLLKAAGKDTLLEMQGLKDPEPEKPSVPRAGTMQKTAAEGAEWVERDANKSSDDEEAEESESNNVDDKPAVHRDNTMEATAKEGANLLSGEKIDPDAATRGQQKKLVKIAEEEDEEEPAPKKPRMAKGVTMVNTAKEAKNLLGDKVPDADAMTRGQQKKIEDIQSEKASPKKPKLSKNTTMAATAKEGAALLGEEKLGDTRAVSKAKQSKAKGGSLKRHSTIQRTMDEAKYVLESGVDVSEGRKTRSGGKKPAPPALKKAGTMQKTAKEGKEFLKRSKKGKKPAKEESEEEVEEEEEEA